MSIIPITINNSLKNISYLIQINTTQAWCIDPTDFDSIHLELSKRKLELVGIINTHSHTDHIGGNEELSENYNCNIYAPKNSQIQNSIEIKENEILRLSNSLSLQAISTPGHMFIHFSYLLFHEATPLGIFSGDSLFVAGIGNCRGGSVELAYKTITKVYSNLPKKINIYSGHNYTLTNIKFAKFVGIKNSILDEIENKCKSNILVFTTLEEEFIINPFFNLQNNNIIKRIEEKTKRNVKEEFEVFRNLRFLRDNW